MLISEKVAYLNGLFDGLDFDQASKEGRVLKGMLDVLTDMAETIESLEYDVEDVMAEVEDLSLDGFDNLDCGDDCGCGCGDHHEDEMDMNEENFDCDCGDDCALECDCECHDDEECGCGCGCDDEALYEVECPTCEEFICFDEETLAVGSTKCHACGEDLEFDTSLIEGEE